jgi:hypothetical protein
MSLKDYTGLLVREMTETLNREVRKKKKGNLKKKSN